MRELLQARQSWLAMCGFAGATGLEGWLLVLCAGCLQDVDQGFSNVGKPLQHLHTIHASHANFLWIQPSPIKVLPGPRSNKSCRSQVTYQDAAAAKQTEKRQTRRACLELLGKLLGKLLGELRWTGCLELLGKLQQGVAADVDRAWPACAGCNVTHLHPKRCRCEARQIGVPFVHTSPRMCRVDAQGFPVRDARDLYGRSMARPVSAVRKAVRWHIQQRMAEGCHYGDVAAAQIY